MADTFSSIDYEESLRKAFVDQHADYIMISSRRQVYQAKVANYGIDMGWLESQWDNSDEQSTVFVCRLTDAGKQHFGLGVNHA